jgi:hypothetical protein
MSQLRTTTTSPATDNTTAVELCDWGGAYCPPAEIHDEDGDWCSHECQSYDRMSEYTWRRRWAA